MYRFYFLADLKQHDMKNKKIEKTSGTELSKGQVSFSESHTASNVAMTESFDNILPDTETEGDLNTDAAYTVVKTEVSDVVDDSTSAGLDTQYELEKEYSTNSKTETSESDPPPFTAICESITEPTVSAAEESAVFSAVHSGELDDAEHILAAQQKQCSSFLKTHSRKRSAESDVREIKGKCQKDSWSLGKTHTNQLSESDIKVETEHEAEDNVIQKSPRMKAISKSMEGNEGFFCGICNWTFKRKTTYDKHLLDNRCILRCGTCDTVFTYRNRENYRKHLKRHIQQYDHKCEDCNKPFIDKYKLLHHQQTIHNKDRQYKCEDCFKTFSSESNLILHKATNHSVEGTYPCPKCTKVFQRPERLSEHLKFNHLIGEDRLLPCSFCGNVYTARYLPIHEKLSHKKTKDFQCELCPAAFISGVELRDHMRRHTKSYREYCETCGKGCYSKTELRNHMRTHSGEKPFVCNLCDYRCALKTNLTKHMKIHNKI